MSIISVNQYYEDQAKNRKETRSMLPDIRYATVLELTLQGEPIIQFEGNALPSQKTYIRLKHYIPSIGDRVMLINNIIIGGWKP